ncbi:MAG: 30S ribosomal protein S9 [Bacteroidetes bacterium]|nr:30S ribosomal protein S9 [Bacteroidota bacterium]
MYTIATGRRKAAIARVYLKSGKGKFEVNGKDYKDYFPVDHLIHKLEEPFKATELEGKYDVKVNTVGGGIKGQAEATTLGIARALVKIDEEYKPALKEKGLIRRDPRVVERKKFGKKKARKSFQFSKR